MDPVHAQKLHATIASCNLPAEFMDSASASLNPHFALVFDAKQRTRIQKKELR